ncbi:Bifunctional protein PutA [compost metagenome]
MYRLLATRPVDAVSRTFQRLDGQNVADAQQRDALHERLGKPLEALKTWAAKNGKDSLASLCDTFAGQSQSGLSRVLPGPTGERNTYVLLPRETVLCLADDEADLLAQLAAALAVGSNALWATSELTGKLRGSLPKAVQARIQLVADWTQADVEFDAVLHHGDSDQLRAVCQQVASRKGPIIGVQGLSQGETAIPLERLLIERAISVNTAAAGGNASLMTIG